VQQLPINLRSHKLFAPREPEVQYNQKQPKQNDRSIVHIGRRDRQLGWEADEGSDHRDEQRRKYVADVTRIAEIEDSRGKGRLTAACSQDTLRDGVCNVLQE